MTKKQTMPPSLQDQEREERIRDKIIVDTYGAEERAMGWYYYLQDKLHFPFMAICDVQRDISPLAEGEKVRVLELASEDTCRHEIFVRIVYRRKKNELAVPLMQLTAADDTYGDTHEALEDWRYWMNMGYNF